MWGKVKAELNPLITIVEVKLLWNFNDSKEFVPIHYFEFPKIYTWAEKDPKKREEIRRAASKDFPVNLPKCKWYAFYIKIKRSRFDRQLDIENVPKLIIDAFSNGIMAKDKTLYRKVALYPDDDLMHVRAFHIEGDFSDDGTNNTKVWIFGKK